MSEIKLSERQVSDLAQLQETGIPSRLYGKYDIRTHRGLVSLGYVEEVERYTFTITPAGRAYLEEHGR